LFLWKEAGSRGDEKAASKHHIKFVCIGRDSGSDLDRLASTKGYKAKYKYAAAKSNAKTAYGKTPQAASGGGSYLLYPATVPAASKAKQINKGTRNSGASCSPSSLRSPFSFCFTAA
jgi:hypothetical protein